MIQQVKDILDNSGYDFNYQIEESHVYSLMELAYNLGKEERPKEMPIIKKVRTQVEDTTDYVGDFFGEIHKQYDREKACEVKNFNNSDTRLSLLKIDDKTVAMVIENRTEFNHCEYIFCQEQSLSAPKVEMSAEQVLDDNCTSLSAWSWNRKQAVLKVMEQYATLKASAIKSLLEDKEKEVAELLELLTQVKDNVLVNYKKNNTYYNLVYNTLNKKA